MPAPSLTFKVAGSTFNYQAAGVEFDTLEIWRRDGWPSLTWNIPGGALGSAGTFDGKPIELWIDCGTGNGSIRQFNGRCISGRPSRDERLGWVKSFTAYGQRWLMDKIPHTDLNSGTDQSKFNLDVDDQDYDAALASRTQGQILQAVLDMPSNNLALTGYGIGGYLSAGYGASATANVSGGAVVSAPMSTQGQNYTTPPNVVFFGGGGFGATGVAVLTGTSITSITITNGGSNYVTEPQVLISNLPIATLLDLAAMQTIIPYPVYFGGQRFGESIDGFLNEHCPNHFQWVSPVDGTLRFFDQRAFGGPLVTILGDGVGATAFATVNSAGQVTSITKVSGGTGYTFDTVLITGGNGYGATATGNISGGGVQSYTVTSGGSNYSRPITLTLDVRDANGGVPTLDPSSWVRSSEHCFSRGVARGSIWTDGVWLSTAPPPGASTGNNGLAENFAHDGLNNAQAKLNWPGTSAFTSPESSAGQAQIIPTLTGGGIAFAVVDPGYSYAIPPAAPPAIVITGGGFTTAATCTLLVNSSGQVTISGQTPGSGYATVPSVVVDFPPNAGPSKDTGTCTCPSSNVIRCTPLNRAKSWPVNFWDQTSTGRHSVVNVYNTGTTGLQSKMVFRGTANTALIPGGTSDLTLDGTLPNMGFNVYRIDGLAGGATVVWRDYQVVDSYYATHIETRFNYPYPNLSSTGAAATLTSIPIARVLYSPSGVAPYDEAPIGITIDKTVGTILTDKPVVVLFGTEANLAVGGSSTDGIPYAFEVLLPVNKGTLNTVWPPWSGSPLAPTYEGTANSIDGLTDCLTITIPAWRDPGNLQNMTAYLAEQLDTVKDVIYEGDVGYLGMLEAAFTPGLALNVNSYDGYPVYGLESADVPIVGQSIKFGTSPKYNCTTRFSSRRAPYSAQQFTRKPFTGAVFGTHGDDVLTGGGFQWNAIDESFGGFAGAASNIFDSIESMFGDALGGTNDAIS
jgi:hypothetical protein